MRCNCMNICWKCKQHQSKAVQRADREREKALQKETLVCIIAAKIKILRRVTLKRTNYKSETVSPVFCFLDE